MSQNTLICTKLYKPRIPANLVSRPWLLEWLSQHQQRPLTLVSASAGYGKTTLISSWLESLKCPSAWMSLDEQDDDLPGGYGGYCLTLTMQPDPDRRGRGRGPTRSRCRPPRGSVDARGDGGVRSPGSSGGLVRP